MIRFKRWIILLCLMLPWSVHAAAWLQPKDKLLSIINNQIYDSCSYWDKQGTLQKGPCFFQYSLLPYFEYGYRDNLSFFVNPDFNTFNQSGQEVPFGFENIFFGGRYSLWKAPWKELSLQLGYNQPIRTSLFGNALSGASAVYAIIQRMRYLDARILYGTGGPLDKAQTEAWYADAEFAYQPNFSGAADEFKFNFMLGRKSQNGRWVFELQEWNAITENNPRNATFPNYNLATVMGNITYWFYPEVAAAQIGIQQDFYGTNIGRGVAPFLSIWWRS